MLKTTKTLLMSLLLMLSINSNAEPGMGIDLTMTPPTPEDFVPEVKIALPKHLSYQSVKMIDVEEVARGAMVMYKCELEIKATTSESLYSMKEFKDGKYHLQEKTKKGSVAILSAIAVVAPSIGGRPNIRVIIKPNTSGGPTGTPLSKYKPGSYVIVSAQ